MANTREGGLKGAAKILARDPEHFKRIGAIGGKNGTGHAFGHGKIDPAEAGRRGGRISRRKPRNA